MLGGIRRRLTFANVISVIALFAALGGGAYAATALPKNSVGSKQIKKNAVTNAKIGKNAVTGAKVKNGSLTGLDINLATLPKVGSSANADNAAHAANADNATNAANATNATNATNAGHATTADTASALTPHEAMHMVGAAGEPGFASGASNYPDTTGPPVVKYHKAGFYKDKEGVVHLQGIVVATSTFLFNLPAGYRPAPGTATAYTVFCNDCSSTVSGGGGGTYYDTSASLLITGSGIDPSIPDGALLMSGSGTTISLDGVSFPAEA